MHAGEARPQGRGPGELAGAVACVERDRAVGASGDHVAGAVAVPVAHVEQAVRADERDTRVDGGTEVEGAPVGDHDEGVVLDADEVGGGVAHQVAGTGHRAQRAHVGGRSDRRPEGAGSRGREDEDRTLGTPRDQVEAAVAVEVGAAGDPVVDAPRAGDGGPGTEAAVALALEEHEAPAVAGEEVDVAVAVLVAGADELHVAAHPLAQHDPLEAALRRTHECDELALVAGDQVVAAVPVEVADRGHQGVAAGRLDDLGGRLEACVALAGPDPEHALLGGGDQVDDPVTGDVGRDEDVLLVLPALGRDGGRLREGRETTGGDDEAAAVAGAADDHVGVRRAHEVGLRGGVADLDRRRSRSGPGGRGRRGRATRDGVRPDVGELGVEVPAGAGGRAGVAVAVDRRELRPAHLLGHRRGVDPVQAELPGEERAVGLEHHLGRLDDVEVADRRHRERVVVVAQGVGTDDGLVDPAVTPLPDPTEAVDEEVVADVAPAAGLHVVGVDAAEDPRHLRLGVVVGVDRVVHEAGADRAVAQGALVADRLVGTPLGAAEDRRLGGLARGLEGDLAGLLTGLLGALLELLVVRRVRVGLGRPRHRRRGSRSRWPRRGPARRRPWRGRRGGRRPSWP